MNFFLILCSGLFIQKKMILPTRPNEIVDLKTFLNLLVFNILIYNLA